MLRFRPLCPRWFLVLGWAAFAASGREVGAEVDYLRDVRPLLSKHCFRCHGPDDTVRKGGVDGLRLDTSEGATEDLGGYAAIAPGDPDASELLARVTSDDPDLVMPPNDHGDPLTPDEIEVVRQWIAEGAHYAQHWAYLRPQRSPRPGVHQTDWPKTEIDYFVLGRLDRESLVPQPEADRYTLIRRVALDLTGLPPTWQEIEAYVHDSAPDAYERMVDHYLAEDSYGEHWARMWLDQARYADSAGYADDPPRTIWAYRDYVIRAFNRNLPFDQFTIEQIAGDLLPHPTDEQRTATAFHRNTPTNNEGGTNDEEFRNVAVIDRVNTTYTVWMGQTMMCAQCHSHKYDPFSQAEYYQSVAFFNNTADADQTDERPTMELWKGDAGILRQHVDRRLRDLVDRLGRLEEGSAALGREGDVAGVDRRPFPVRPGRESLRREREALTSLRDQLQPVTTVPIQQELPSDSRRKTHIQVRGNFLDLGAEVTAHVPHVFPPLEGDPPTRLDFARWLVRDDNPLTARVAVNRIWEQIFGTGLVATAEDFGTQGDLPSHPDLLDWLACEFMERGWDTKHLLRIILGSATYRQSSRTTAELRRLDPDNRLLARGPRVRLPAETIRDQALAVSGLLCRTKFGPPVRPAQPELGLTAAFGSGLDWQTSESPDRYRRGIYTMWRRSNPYPSLSAFDAPSREVCTPRRTRTNTPLQALVTLNDPVYLEAAQALARRMMVATTDTRGRAAWGLRACLGRPAQEAEINSLVRLQEQAWQQLRGNPGQAAALATEPLGPAPDAVDLSELASWSLVGNALLNLDELFMKR